MTRETMTRNGNTPVEAGKTSREGQATVKSRKHPRRGGEDFLEAHLNAQLVETPPPRRGRLGAPWPVPQARGNTPAEAGKTLATPGATHSTRKHPRRGGEDTLAHGIDVSFWETPPPRRGRRHRYTFFRFQPGNTPAEAGKTGGRTARHEGLEKHPRRGGEDSTF